MSADILAFPGRRIFRRETAWEELVVCSSIHPKACLPDTEENEPVPNQELWDDPPEDPLSMSRYFRRIAS
jgi:hypothetical protein